MDRAEGIEAICQTCGTLLDTHEETGPGGEHRIVVVPCPNCFPEAYAVPGEG